MALEVLAVCLCVLDASWMIAFVSALLTLLLLDACTKCFHTCCVSTRDLAPPSLVKVND